jgi:hypothetical protein
MWHWDRVFEELLDFPLSISFHRGSPYSYISWGMNNRPDGRPRVAPSTGITTTLIYQHSLKGLWKTNAH